MTTLAELSLADLRVAVDEYVKYCQDQQQTEGGADRRVLLRTMRAELARRVDEIMTGVAT